MDGQIVFHFALNNKLNYFCNYVKFGCMEQRLHVLTKLGSNIKLAGQVIGLGTPSTQKQNLSQTYFEKKKMQLKISRIQENVNFFLEITNSWNFVLDHLVSENEISENILKKVRKYLLHTSSISFTCVVSKQLFFEKKLTVGSSCAK